MPRRAVPTGTPEEWLRRAKSNLVRAKQVKPAGAYWEGLCFDTEQAAEKAVKAILTTSRSSSLKFTISVSYFHCWINQARRFREKFGEWMI